MIKKLITTTLAVTICIFFLVPQASGKLYTWIDKSGKTMRTYYSPPADRVQSKSSSIAKQSVTSYQVELYVTSWCQYCKSAKKFFSSKGIPVTVYDIEKDVKAAARKKKLDNQGGGVPFAVVNGVRIHGYAPDQYTKALKKNR